MNRVEDAFRKSPKVELLQKKKGRGIWGLKPRPLHSGFPQSTSEALAWPWSSFRPAFRCGLRILGSYGWPRAPLTHCQWVVLDIAVSLPSFWYPPSGTWEAHVASWLSLPPTLFLKLPIHWTCTPSEVSSGTHILDISHSKLMSTYYTLCQAMS